MLMTLRNCDGVYCPFLLILPYSGVSHCAGCDCAMWRWAPSNKLPDELKGQRVGYCGLAGKPLEIDQEG